MGDRMGGSTKRDKSLTRLFIREVVGVGESGNRRVVSGGQDEWLGVRGIKLFCFLIPLDILLLVYLIDSPESPQ